MGEPEELLVEAAAAATNCVQRLWQRRGAAPLPGLAALKTRLELFAAALAGDCPPIVAANAPPPPTLLRRLFGRAPARPLRAVPSTDGTRIRLPAAAGDALAELPRWRLFALEQAARAVRGSPHHVPPEPLRAALYGLAEAAAVDAWIAAELPGLAPLLAAERARALAARPDPGVLTPREQALEQLLRAVLAAPVAGGPVPVPASPDAARAWAERTAAQLEREPGPFRGLPAVEPWGELEPAPPRAPAAELAIAADEPRAAARASAELPRRPRARTGEDEDDAGSGTFVVKGDAAEMGVEDAMGMQRPADRDDAQDAAELAEALAELPAARLVRTPGTPREVLLGDEPPPRSPVRVLPAGAPSGTIYPEWDWTQNAYLPRGAVVRAPAPPLGDAQWTQGVLRRHAGLVREVRWRFERLRLDRLRARRQTDGAELDLEAFVTGFADRRAGGPCDDRLYVATRRLRRDLVATLLVDVSASTDSWVSQRHRIIDVEKEALVVVCEAFDRLGHAAAILAFSGEGPHGVAVWSLKGFDERLGAAVQRRIAALEPDRYTRTGAAVRHATALLSRQRARHRLLLLLSDGKPNDVDRYSGRHGVEDARQAVMEARLAGVTVFCLTVDRHAPAYAARIFGASGFRVLREPERLPRVLVELLKRLVSR